MPTPHGDRGAADRHDRADRKDRYPEHLERAHDVLHRLFELHLVRPLRDHRRIHNALMSMPELNTL